MSLLGDIDTIEELPKILVVDLAELVDLSAKERDSVLIVTLDPDFFLLDWGIHNLNTLWSLDMLLLSLTHEVSEAELVLVGADGVLDWEVSSDEPHLVAVALSDTNDHVLDVAEEGASPSDKLTVAEPAAGEDLLSLLEVLDIEAEVGEIADEGAPWAGDGDDAGLDLKGDVLFIDIHMVGVEDWTWHELERPKPFPVDKKFIRYDNVK